MRRSSEKLRVNFDTHIILPQGRITQRGRSAQRDGDPAGTLAAPHLHQRPLRLGEHRRPEPVRTAAAPGAAAAGGDRQTRPDSIQRRGQRRQRRRQRHRADDGAGARVCGERHPVRRDAGVHHLGRRGTGPGRLQRARRGSQEEQRAHRSRLQQRHRRQLDRRQRHSRCRVDQGLCGRSRGFAGAIAGALHQEDRGRLRAVASRSPDGA